MSSSGDGALDPWAGTPEITGAGRATVSKSRDADLIKVQNEDELRLAQMGHKQELVRHFSVWSLIGLAANCNISWTGLGLGLITAINGGGPGALIYGFIFVWILQSFVGASLAEFVFAYPTEGGMYHWIAAIAPKRYNSLLSFATGWSTVFGWIFTTASTILIYATTAMALIALYHEDLVVQPWMTFVAYQILNIVTSGIVMFGNRFIPAINKFSLIYLQLAWFITMVTVAASAPVHNDSKFVFRTWINNTGWDNNVMCFITGLVNPLYSLGGLDGISHITEEMPNPGKNAPLGLAITLSIALVTGLAYLLSLMFSVQNYNSLVDTQTGLPLAEIFFQATSTKGGAFGLVFMVWVALGPCVIGSQLSTGRAFWAFSRDDGLPLSRVTINNLAYLVPILTNVLLFHKTMQKGPFSMNQFTGMTVNIISVLWLIFAIVFFSFPFEMPATSSNMNYTCVVIGGFLAIELAWWIIAGKKYSETVQRAREEERKAPMIVDETDPKP
ncbi:uncharacterized protein N7498_000301 [Penicillium cinerascens]|uniref:Amino acid permease/ SLC12A domain-containing protein n=1 Tax=Penicillium cinerascens TaxID=70096 RepID=A0A9W9NE36_9EURO|nr:uncharacterized protein N7498_000301 [Penicillium cinerascens]KAJ5218202.1 hypothetical protein N7498_000301 [Penicillium cinerascens]